MPRNSKTKPTKSEFSEFESALSELEKLVERMERGDQTLEESLKDFERGVALAKQCQTTLKQAEQRVETLMNKNGDLVVELFSPDE